ncbi:iron chelate uptake ABC transporter family permease subunit [Propioniciclava sinopodophylli]|uniref:iron chelate uptake ABC transporter family permease subunit n=1 Tax=Propioniciclava sinopodophylli TaxID=1837344 RepID=UPI0019D5AD9C|nr:iron chelate uptake ABC transporter family permease subunit [Propioniciclava sinopodophylli]
MAETLTARPTHDLPSEGSSRARAGLWSRPGVRLGLLVALAAASVAVYLLTGLSGNLGFILGRRAVTLATLVLVATAVGVSTVLFHTVTANRILTPSIMGLDSLYIALQTAAVFVFGAFGASTLPAVPMFALELLAMVAFSLLLFSLVMGRFGRSLTLMLLVGVLVGGMFRGVSSFLQRLMSPEDFQVLSDRFFADFTGADPALLGVSAIVVGALTLAAWLARHQLDVVGLGRDLAICLGINHRRLTMVVLVGVALMVGTSTALVGPTMFFGLLSSHLAYRALGTQRHAWTIPGSILAGTVALVGGQWAFERVLGLEGSLSMIVEFVGGITFIVLLLAGGRRR